VKKSKYMKAKATKAPSVVGLDFAIVKNGKVVTASDKMPPALICHPGGSKGKKKTKTTKGG
jgi:hypothetical protein